MRRAHDIPSAIINLRIAVAESLGANRQEILKAINIDPSVLNNPKAKVTVEQAMDVWAVLVNHTTVQTIGLECGMKTQFQTMGILGYVMMNSTSILNAWRKLCAYQELVLSILFHKIQTENERVIIKGEMQEKWQRGFQYTIDFIYASTFTLIKNCSSKEILPIEIGFNYPIPKDLTRYHEIFHSTNLIFSCDDPYIIYKRSDLENKITGTDSNLFEQFDVLLQDKAKEHDKINAHSRSVKNSILKRLKAEIPKAEEVARDLTMSVRSLQVCLKKEGTSFQKILNNVRKEIAIKQLSRPDFNVTDVAFFTGYSSVSIFSRNFKKWTGLTPTEFQNHN